MIGFLLVMLFIFSDLAKDPQYRYLIYGFLGVISGIVLKASTKNKEPTRPSGRFRILRKRSQLDERDTDNP